MLRKQEELIKLHEAGWKFFTVHSVNEYGQCTCRKDDCVSPGKHPLEYRWQETARRWPHPFPEKYNVGVPCGNQCIVLDIDPRNGGKETLDALIKRYGELPETWTVLTGGNGFHFYFKAPYEDYPSGNQFKAQGVELKGAGSYVIGPGSNHISGSQYEWQEGHRPEDLPLAEAPKWLLEQCQTKRTVNDTPVWDGATDLEELKDALNAIEPDINRHDWIRVGAALKTAGLGFEAWNEWSAKGSKYKKDEMEAQWNSLESGKVNPETIFHLAYERGWTPPMDNTPLNFQFKKKEVREASSSGCPELPDNPIFKEIANEILETALHKHQPFAIAATLSVIAGLAQGSYCTPVKEGYLGCYYILMAGASAGKEHYGSRAIDVIRMVAEHRVLRMPSSSQALRFELVDCNARVLYMDEALRTLQMKIESKTSNDHMLMTDIMSIWGMSSKILSGYSTKKEADKTPDVKMPFLSIIGCGTTEKFDHLLRHSQDLISDGLLSRFDIVQSNYRQSSFGKQNQRKFEISDYAMRILSEISGSGSREDTFIMPKGNDQVGTKKTRVNYYEQRAVEFTENSMEMWSDIFRRYNEKACVDSENNIASSLWNRGAEKILRTASLLAIIRNHREPRIVPADLDWSLAWHEWIISEMEARVLDKSGQSYEAEIGEVILEQLTRHVRPGKFVPLGQLRHTSRRLRNTEVKVLERAVEGLELSGLILVKTVKKGRASIMVALPSQE